MLRKKGVSINQMATIIGRSTSLIHRILKKASFLARVDLRKIPTRIKLLGAARIRKFLAKTLQGWQEFILGQGEKPP